MKSNSFNTIEVFFFWAIALTWPFYFVGALYIVAPSIAWSALALLLMALYLGPALRPEYRCQNTVPLVVWSWIVGMAIMLAALLVGHIGWDLSSLTMLKSTIGWMKGWALAAIFPLLGAMLPIRREPLILGQLVVAACTLALLPLLIAAPYVGLPSQLYVSPLKIFDGSGLEYFSTFLYTLDPFTLAPRWQFYAPWAPFAGLLGVVTVLFALESSNRGQLIVMALAGVAMVGMSKSRISLVALVVCTIAPRLLPFIINAGAWRVMAAIVAAMAVLGEFLLNMFDAASDIFKESRADSSKLRDTLQRIAIDRWSREAPWFGHGTVERGPHLVEYMPIGSHHTWFGLLYVKGMVGVSALLLPMASEFLFTLVDAIGSRRGRLPFGLMLTFAILSLGENIEVEVYLFWPSFMLLGIHAREVESERFAAATLRASRNARPAGDLVAA